MDRDRDEKIGKDVQNYGGNFIVFEKVRKEYVTGGIKTVANDDVSFTVGEGEFCVIVGASGAGKTTVLNILGGMDRCDSGRITVGEKEISGLKEKQLVEYRRHDVGFVFQFYNLMQNLTAVENVEIASEICLNPMPANDALNAVGLQGKQKNFPSQLSGGEQQRVSIARAIAKNPKILLCDEPTGALDYLTGKNILKLLYDICRERKKTVIVITHNLAITKMADRIIHIKNGRAEKVEQNLLPIDPMLLEW